MAEKRMRIEESFRQLEMKLQAAGWQRMTSSFDETFSKSSIDIIASLAELFAVSSPLVKRALNVIADNVFARGVTVSSRSQDVEGFVRSFLSDMRNQQEFFGYTRRIELERRLHVDGNLFFSLRNEAGQTLMSFIDSREIQMIARSSYNEILFYKRKSSKSRLDMNTGEIVEVEETTYHPSLTYRPSHFRPSIGSERIKWDEPIIHLKVNGLAGRDFGISSVYAAFDWLEIYEAFLRNWFDLTKTVARYSYRVTVKNQKGAVEEAKKSFDADLKPRTTRGAPIGGIKIMTDDARLERLPATVALSADDGRRILLKFCAAFGLSEQHFGDISSGSYATSQTMERNVELMISSRQSAWAEIYQLVTRYAIWMSAQYGELQGKVTWQNKHDGSQRLFVGNEEVSVSVSFPDLLQKDMTQVVKAVSDAAPHVEDKELIMKLMLEALGVDNASILASLISQKDNSNNNDSDDSDDSSNNNNNNNDSDDSDDSSNNNNNDSDDSDENNE